VTLLASTMFAIPVLPPGPFMPPSCRVRITCASHSFAFVMIGELGLVGYWYSGRYSNDKVGSGHGRGRLDSPQAWCSNSYGKGYSGDIWMELDAGSVKVCVCMHLFVVSRVKLHAHSLTRTHTRVLPGWFRRAEQTIISGSPATRSRLVPTARPGMKVNRVCLRGM